MEMKCLVLLPCLFLYGCDTLCSIQETKIVYKEHYVFSQPDESLRNCITRLQKPELKTNKDVAKLIANLDERGEDCSAKLVKTWESIDKTKENVETLNKDSK
jgi:hypothetical protein